MINQFIIAGKLLSKRLNYGIISVEEADIEVYIPDALMPIINRVSNGTLLCVTGKIMEYHSLHATQIMILEEHYDNNYSL